MLERRKYSSTVARQQCQTVAQQRENEWVSRSPSLRYRLIKVASTRFGIEGTSSPHMSVVSLKTFVALDDDKRLGDSLAVLTVGGDGQQQ
jgi:hypothetical protein